VACHGNIESRDRPDASTESSFALCRKMDATHLSRFFRGGTPQELRRRAGAQEVGAPERSFPQPQLLRQVVPLSPLPRGAQMRSWRHSLLLETQEAHLRDRNYAHGAARRFFSSGDEIAPAALPAVSDRPPPARTARA